MLGKTHDSLQIANAKSLWMLTAKSTRSNSDDS